MNIWRSLFLAAVPMSVVGDVDFHRDIRPILVEHCLSCHGGIKRKGDLSFLSFADARAALVPGKPEASELFRRIVHPDPEERMPAGKEPLSTAKVELMRRWIAEGAKWPTHWAFAPVRKVAPPRVRTPGRNAIDQFVRAGLEREGIEPAPEADPRTLVRRLYLDLLGLLPPPGEVDADDRLVDRLLASPHFGERWGRHWLDLARYADTDGYEVDGDRPHAWHWRDWVIKAINDDMPFDQFTLEQLAGDLLPNASFPQRLATAFHRQTLVNKEGGIDKEEYRTYAVMDRVSTTAAVWQGLTMACAQCHDHPYDPVTQREYYRWLAVFNNADETTLKKLDVLEERAEPRPTYLLRRGDFLQPLTNEVIQPLGNRLELARSLVDSTNALTARVAVNNIWMHLFGEGLVRTPDDFGASGELPTHPELLEWLAQEFVGRNWSRKSLIKLIVTSATYRQSSRHRPELAHVDPENRLLHRQNRFRVEAEIMRDTALQAAGLLSPRIGGPSVFPPIPQDLTKIDFRSDMKWKTSVGEDRYRRGMYTFFKRTLPDPNLTLFDCPDASATSVQRRSSNTPLQALACLNNEVFVEAAQVLGTRRNMFERALSREPTEREQGRLRELYEINRDWTAVASTVLNLDEFVTRE